MAKTLNFYLASLLILILMDVNGQKLPKNSPIRFLALGDSYTIGESVAEVQRWPVQLANAFTTRGYRFDPPEIVAATGWRTDDLTKAIKMRNLPSNFDLVSLLIGVNNQYQGKSLPEYAMQFEELLDVAIGHAGGDKSKVFVLSIPDYGYTPFGREKQTEISQEIDAFNSLNKKISKEKAVEYVEITDISRRGLDDKELIAEDGLHPSGKMYALWVERIISQLR